MWSQVCSPGIYQKPSPGALASIRSISRDSFRLNIWRHRDRSQWGFMELVIPGSVFPVDGVKRAECTTLPEHGNVLMSLEQVTAFN